MTQVQDFQAPVVEPQEVNQSESATHYGVLVGGFAVFPWAATGEQSIGHRAIPRRKWMTFTNIRVGRRNEFEGALDMDMTAIQRNWATNPDRVVTKSARSCARDVIEAHRAQGYCVPRVLIGHPNAQRLAEKVWPAAVRASKRLHEQIEYFEGFRSDDEEEATLAAELLEALYICREDTSENVRALKAEMQKEYGLKTLNPALEELFFEINEPLPERKNLSIAQEMGKAMVSDGRKDDAIVGALNAVVARLEALEAKPGLTEEASDVQTSNTQPGVNKDGSPDRRLKANKGAE